MKNNEKRISTTQWLKENMNMTRKEFRKLVDKIALSQIDPESPIHRKRKKIR